MEVLDASAIYSDDGNGHGSLLEGCGKRYRVGHFCQWGWRVHGNEMEIFGCEVAKDRFLELRGIQKEKFNLHLKETKWCFYHSSLLIFCGKRWTTSPTGYSKKLLDSLL
jgi:hypothetical protein